MYILLLILKCVMDNKIQEFKTGLFHKRFECFVFNLGKERTAKDFVIFFHKCYKRTHDILKQLLVSKIPKTTDNSRYEYILIYLIPHKDRLS